MKIEHFAINVENPPAMVDWYVENLGLEIIRQMNEAPHTTFLADESGRVMLEIYTNPPGEVPDYPNMNPLIVHLAFVSENPASDKERLISAGATVVTDEHLKDNSHLIMMRDPWGFCIQLCKRGKPMLKEKEDTF
ncbi:MAG: VOC family protein [Balneolaceae bacterium]